MNIRKTLQNPFALIAQGFVAGAVLFFATTPDMGASQTADARVEAAARTITA